MKDRNNAAIGGSDETTAPIAHVNGDPKLVVPVSDDKKKLVTLEGGHVPNDVLGLIRNILNWYDTHLGPVK
jgi:hypothetical protein